MLETLENLSSRLRMPPLIPAEVEKIRECIRDNKNATMELEKLQPSFEALKRRGEELIGRSQGVDKDLAAKGKETEAKEPWTFHGPPLLLHIVSLCFVVLEVFCTWYNIVFLHQWSKVFLLHRQGLKIF